MKIVVLDALGMAGHMISQYINESTKHEVIDVIFEKSIEKNVKTLNIFNVLSIKKELLNIEPDVIINTVRVLVDESEKFPDKAIYINSFFPRYLETLFLRRSTKVIHLSTDCVFSGKKGEYNEEDVKDGESMYAKTRELGEIVNKKDLTIRTSFIGPVITKKQEELFDWFMMQKGEINGYVNALWTGITTLELAKGILKAIELNLTGIYHLVPDSKISKYDLLCIIKRIWNKSDVKINKYDNEFIDKSLVDTNKQINIKSYELMFYELFAYMQNKKYIYNKYI